MFEEIEANGFGEFSDNELIKLFREGNQTAFHQLVLRYMFAIKRKAADMNCRSMDFDDLVQEGFLGLYNAVNGYDERGGASFRTYAMVCIRNRMLSALRSAGREIDTEELSEEIPARAETEPENAFIIKEDFARLVRYIEEKLSKSELKVLSLYLEGKSYDEIASELNKSRKFCDNAMQRVRKKLAISSQQFQQG